MHSTLNRFVKSISTYSSMALIHIPRVVEVAQEKVFGASTVSVSVVAKVLDNLEEAARKVRAFACEFLFFKFFIINYL